MSLLAFLLLSNHSSSTSRLLCCSKVRPATTSSWLADLQMLTPKLLLTLAILGSFSSRALSLPQVVPGNCLLIPAKAIEPALEKRWPEGDDDAQEDDPPQEDPPKDDPPVEVVRAGAETWHNDDLIFCNH